MSRTFDYLGVGLGPNQVNPALVGGGLCAYPMEISTTDLLDLTVPNLGIELIPAKPGYIPVLANMRWLVEVSSGTQTAAANANAGSDPAHINYFQAFSSPSNANIAAIAGLPIDLSFVIVTASPNTIRRPPNTPVILDITSGATGTGGFALKSKVFTYYSWFPAGGIS